ncbi:MarR family transcriptional regulator [Bengtsoniella intestinalis]|uniref:MarR family winged helix-turn-helix transcriptional regulator n=1 Tax=Bengtsoniella intestinalis TaxID=3073143 RepID=UPI00391EF21C
MAYDILFLRYFRQISEMIEKNGDAKLKDLGLTLTQGHILGYLRHKEDFTASYKEIESVSKVAQSSAASMIARLEARGFVKTFTDPSDKRVKLLSITELGKVSSDASHAHMEDLQKELFAKLTEEEVQALMESLRKITD